MNGIQSLMGGGQGPMPGQAPQQPMPGMMPQQGAPTPQAMVDQLATMPFEKLEQFYSNPRPQSPPLYAVIAAIVKQQKAAQMAQAQQGQQVMAQNAQMQQQPPIAEGIMQQARQQHMPQMPQQTVMAAYGGEMHGYADGGAVAFAHGGNVQHFSNGSNPFGVQSDAITQAQAPVVQQLQSLQAQLGQAEQMLAAASKSGDPTSLTMYAQAVQALRSQIDKVATQNFGNRAADVVKGLTTSSDTSKLFPFGPPESPMMDVPEIQIRQPSPTAPRRQPAAQKPTATGIGALVEQPGTPAIDAYAAASAAQQEAIRRMGQVTPEELAARGGIDKRLEEQAATFAGETQRRKDLAQQRMQEALGIFERPGRLDMAGIGRLLEGMKGAKTLYGGLVGAGAAAGKYQEDKEAALRAAQEKFDLSGKEVFELSRLQDQMKMKQAELVEARASGDAQRSVKAALDVATAQKDLASYQTELGMKREKLALESRDTESRRISAEAARAQAGKPSETLALLQALFPGQAPSVENLRQIAEARQPSVSDKLAVAREKNEIARQKLLESDMTYFGLRNTYLNATDPAKKAEALRKMREIERLKGIVDEASVAPDGGAIDRTNPLLK